MNINSVCAVESHSQIQVSKLMCIGKNLLSPITIEESRDKML